MGSSAASSDLPFNHPKAKSCYTEAFLDRLMEAVQGKVLLIWDQASWHTSQAVEKLIEGYERLEVLLPPKRAPQENPVIETVILPGSGARSSA